MWRYTSTRQSVKKDIIFGKSHPKKFVWFSSFKDKVYFESLRQQTPKTTQWNFGSFLVIPPQIKRGIVTVMKKQKLYLNKSEVAPVKTSR